MHTAYPAIKIKENKNIPFLIPKISMKIPPKSGNTIFGKE